MPQSHFLAGKTWVDTITQQRLAALFQTLMGFDQKPSLIPIIVLKHQGSAIYKDPKRVWRGITHNALENQNCQIVMANVVPPKN